MTIEINKTRIKTLVNLMKGIRMIEDTEVFSEAQALCPESRNETTTIYFIGEDFFPGLLIDTGRGYFFVRKEKIRISRSLEDVLKDNDNVGVFTTEHPLEDGVSVYADHLRIEDWSGSDWVEYEFDPHDGIYGLSRNCEDMFTGGFMDACKFILDFWMGRD